MSKPSPQWRRVQQRVDAHTALDFFKAEGGVKSCNATNAPALAVTMLKALSAPADRAVLLARTKDFAVEIVPISIWR